MAYRPRKRRRRQPRQPGEGHAVKLSSGPHGAAFENLVAATRGEPARYHESAGPQHGINARQLARDDHPLRGLAPRATPIGGLAPALANDADRDGVSGRCDGVWGRPGAIGTRRPSRRCPGCRADRASRARRRDRRTPSRTTRRPTSSELASRALRRRPDRGRRLRGPSASELTRRGSCSNRPLPVLRPRESSGKRSSHCWAERPPILAAAPAPRMYTWARSFAVSPLDLVRSHPRPASARRMSNCLMFIRRPAPVAVRDSRSVFRQRRPAPVPLAAARVAQPRGRSAQQFRRGEVPRSRRRRRDAIHPEAFLLQPSKEEAAAVRAALEATPWRSAGRTVRVLARGGGGMRVVRAPFDRARLPSGRRGSERRRPTAFVHGAVSAALDASRPWARRCPRASRRSRSSDRLPEASRHVLRGDAASPWRRPSAAGRAPRPRGGGIRISSRPPAPATIASARDQGPGGVDGGTG